MSIIETTPAPVKVRRTRQQREADGLAEEQARWAAKSPEEKAARLATLKARNAAGIAADKARCEAEEKARRAEEARKVNVLGWAHDQLADVHTCPRLRDLAQCLLNTASVFERFVPPIMTDEERAGYDRSQALVAVAEGRASYRPAASGFGMVRGLTDSERNEVLGAEDAARVAVCERYTGSWDLFAANDHAVTEAIEAGKVAGKAALRRVLAARPRQTDPAPPDDGGEGPSDRFEPTAEDRAEHARWYAAFERQSLNRSARSAIVPSFTDADAVLCRGYA